MARTMTTTPWTAAQAAAYAEPPAAAAASAADIAAAPAAESPATAPASTIAQGPVAEHQWGAEQQGDSSSDDDGGGEGERGSASAPPGRFVRLGMKPKNKEDGQDKAAAAAEPPAAAAAEPPAAAAASAAVPIIPGPEQTCAKDDIVGFFKSLGIVDEDAENPEEEALTAFKAALDDDHITFCTVTVVDGQTAVASVAVVDTGDPLLIRYMLTDDDNGYTHVNEMLSFLAKRAVAAGLTDGHTMAINTYCGDESMYPGYFDNQRTDRLESSPQEILDALEEEDPLDDSVRVLQMDVTAISLSVGDETKMFERGVLDSLPDELLPEQYETAYRAAFDAGDTYGSANSAPMHLLGATIGSTSAKYGFQKPDGSGNGTLPRMLMKSRPDAPAYEVLQQPWLIKLAEELWARNISYAERFDPDMLKDMLMALDIIPKELRIGATGFCTLATISDLSSGYNHKHIDSNDVTSCFITLGIGVEGGSTVYFNGKTADDAGDEIHKVELQHGQYQTGAFHEVLHATDAWEGPRATLSFFLRRDLLKHFETYGDQYYMEHRLRMYYLGETDADELPHGDGAYVYMDGRVYDGTWKHGVPRGQGKLVKGDIISEGVFKLNGPNDDVVLHGLGVRETPNGRHTKKLKGNFYNGFPHGMMKRTLPNGNEVAWEYQFHAGRSGSNQSEKRDFDPECQDYHGKAACIFQYTAGNEPGKLQALDDGNYLFTAGEFTSTLDPDAAKAAVARAGESDDDQEELADLLGDSANSANAGEINADIAARNMEHARQQKGSVVKKRKRKQAKRRSKAKKKSTATTSNRGRGGGFIDVPGIEKASVGGLRSCVQDAVVIGADRLGVVIDSKTLLKQAPARKTKDSTLEEIENAACINGVIDFTNENYHRLQGGPEFNLLQIRDDAPRLVIATVYGRTKTEHAFIFDPIGIIPGPFLAHSGLLIDNRRNHPHRLLEDSDRATVDSVRGTINSFFGKADTRVSQVYKMGLAGAEMNVE